MALRSEQLTPRQAEWLRSNLEVDPFDDGDCRKVIRVPVTFEVTLADIANGRDPYSEFGPVALAINRKLHPLYSYVSDEQVSMHWNGFHMCMAYLPHSVIEFREAYESGEAEPFSFTLTLPEDAI